LITLVTIVHVFVCVFLILVILLQAGKGGGMGTALGGGGAQTVFGGRGAQTLLGKVTSVSAAIFMLTSVTLAYSASRSTSVVRRAAATQRTQPAKTPLAPPPAAPASPAAPGSEAPAQPAPSH
jgi:preprotein translocase subunit SecG